MYTYMCVYIFANDIEKQSHTERDREKDRERDRERESEKETEKKNSNRENEREKYTAATIRPRMRTPGMYKICTRTIRL